MKEFKQLINEKKATKKRRKDEGADDQRYFKLMSDYKQARRHDKDEAEKLREEMKKLIRNGDVSSRARMGANYL